MKEDIRQAFALRQRTPAAAPATPATPAVDLSQTTRRELAVEVRILDQAAGICQYVASNESLDSYQEVVRVNGWRFKRFAKNAPFVDSHNYYCIDSLLGKVTAQEVRGGQLLETVQWAVNAGLPEDHLANIGWKLTVAGYLKAVSVGFTPIKYATKWDADKTVWTQQLRELGMHEEDGIRAVYIEQDQLELSACILGSNPDAVVNVGKAFKAGVISDSNLHFLSGQFARRETTAKSAPAPAHADPATAQARQRFLDKIETIVGNL